jgi:hypothetical protein
MRDARGRSLLDEPERRTAVRETAAEPAARAVKEPAFRPAGELSARPVKEMPLRPVGETPARSVGDPPSPKVSISERNTERGERSAAEDAGKDGLKESIKESIKKLVRDPSAGDAEMPPAAGRKPQPQPVLEPEEPPAASLEAEPIDPERSRYRNVISTLLIDIEEMKRQREEYQQYIFNNAPDAVKYKRWVVSLDEAIEEFTGAARILSRYRK